MQETRKICSDCGEEISGPYYKIEDDEVVCAVDFKVEVEAVFNNSMISHLEKTREL